MNVPIGLAVCVVLLAHATWVNAQDTTNQVHLVPTNNIAAARSKYPLSDFDRIAPNTLTFEEWALNFMLGKANEVREKWQLDIPKPLTVNGVLFQLKATVHGIDGGIGTRDHRYTWRFSRNALDHFYDTKYCPRSFRHKDEESERLAKVTSKITPKEAEIIARDALHKLGLSEKQLRLKEPPAVNQYAFEESDGRVYPLPMFNVAWRLEGYPEPEGDEAPFEPVVLDLSGITERVAEYFNVNRYTPRDPLPTNYFNMLGLPENYLETLPDRTRQWWGLPPRTDSDAPIQKHK